MYDNEPKLIFWPLEVAVSGRKKHEKLRARRGSVADTQENRTRTEAITAAYNACIRLAELRRERGLVQHQVAERMGVSQSAVCQYEEATDLHLSTLAHYVSALGGYVEVRAVLPNEQGREVPLMTTRKMLRR